MDENDLQKIRDFAEKHLAGSKCAAHNIEHVNRVYNLAMKLAKGEKLDVSVIQAAVLLHDIGGEKELSSSTADHAVESAKMAEPFLKKLGFSQQKINHILDCIITHRYRSEAKPKTKEAMIVFDADKLETVGATGIARMFVWVGRHNAHIYRKTNLKEYAKENLDGGKLNGKILDKTKHSPQLNFETKDKYIMDYLFTENAKKIARKRLAFYEKFLAKLEREIKGLN